MKSAHQTLKCSLLAGAVALGLGLVAQSATAATVGGLAPTDGATEIEPGIPQCNAWSRTWLAAPDPRAMFCVSFASGGYSLTGQPWTPNGWSPAKPYICCYDGFGGL